MTKKWNGIDRRNSLRAEAEGMLVSLSPDEKETQPNEMLMHELLVHKVDLEIQNEELRRANNAIEEARDRYLDLYEFAPVGYIAINRDGLIEEINLTASALLGAERNKLVNRRFSALVAPEDRDRWHRLFMNMMEQDKVEKLEFGLAMTGADGAVFQAHLNCLRRKTLDSPPMLRVALVDISKSKQAQSII